MVMDPPGYLRALGTCPPVGVQPAFSKIPRLDLLPLGGRPAAGRQSSLLEQSTEQTALEDLKDNSQIGEDRPMAGPGVSRQLSPRRVFATNGNQALPGGSAARRFRPLAHRTG